MASYITNSGFPNLVGSMEVINDEATSYTSDSLRDTVQPQPLGGPGLHFKVKFRGDNRTYHIRASASGDGYAGTADDHKDPLAQEEWTATASTGDTADAAAAGSGYGSAADETPKKSPTS